MGDGCRCTIIPCSRHIALGHEGLIQHGHTGFLHSGFGRQVRTRRHTAQQPQLRQHQRAGALRAQQLPGGIRLQLCPTAFELPGASISGCRCRLWPHCRPSLLRRATGSRRPGAVVGSGIRPISKMSMSP